MSAFERVAECWRRLYFRNCAWASPQHAQVHERLLAMREAKDATAQCRACKEHAFEAATLGGGVVCEPCLIYALVHLCAGIDDDPMYSPSFSS